MVKDGLYTASLSEKFKALKTIDVWRIRGGIPSSADATGQLVSVLFQEETQTAASHESLRMQYSIAVLRAVNMIVEPNQQGYYAQSVMVLAQKAGLPGWIVELRHEATHKQLPSKSLLRSAALFLIDWYNRNYWQPQFEFLQASTSICAQALSAATPDLFLLGKQFQSPSFTSDILVPLLMTSIQADFQSHDQSALTSNSTSVTKSCVEEVSLLLLDSYHRWRPVFRYFFTRRSTYSPTTSAHNVIAEQLCICVVCRILDSLHNVVSMDKNPQQEIAVKVLTQWIGHLLYDFVSTYHESIPSPLQLVQRQFVRTSLNRVHTLSFHQSSKPFIDVILKAIEAYCNGDHNGVLSLTRLYSSALTPSNTRQQTKKKLQWKRLQIRDEEIDGVTDAKYFEEREEEGKVDFNDGAEDHDCDESEASDEGDCNEDGDDDSIGDKSCGDDDNSHASESEKGEEEEYPRDARDSSSSNYPKIDSSLQDLEQWVATLSSVVPNSEGNVMMANKGALKGKRRFIEPTRGTPQTLPAKKVRLTAEEQETASLESYQDVSSKSLPPTPLSATEKSIRVFEGLGMWPMGLWPGRFDCLELHHLVVAPSNPSVLEIAENSETSSKAAAIRA